MTVTIFDHEPETNESGTRFLIKDLPSFFEEHIEKTPDYSPRKRHVVIKILAGKNIDNPFIPFVVSNHLFVDVLIPFINERRRILMDSNIDMAIKNLPKKWDDNYNSNAFEIVNEDTNPVLQVIYKSPSEVLVNGVFLLNGYTIIEAFNASPNTFRMQMGFNQSTQLFVMPLEEFVKTFTNVSINMDTNNIFRSRFPNQKAIFKYPSLDYLGVLADPVPETSSSKLAEKIAFGITGAGILWMCFGWLFFQKRSNIKPP